MKTDISTSMIAMSKPMSGAGTDFFEKLAVDSDNNSRHCTTDSIDIALAGSA